jgi:D-alanyl-lipoteichoic acid acyltransferase DltB (MBOAT superfamily)
LFITFFPHLIAGPIVHHGVLLPQLEDDSNARLDFSNFAKGIFLFNIGLAKKVIIADTVASIVSTGYSNTELLTTVQAWITSLAYSVQLYFDFSGYSDMAIGLALLFNIRIPINFNSPYKAVNIQDFWRRWHITLSQFLRDYLYIPLGGNRRSELRTSFNLVITFVIGGIWHGAGWTFLFWGFLHGIALVFHRFFKKTNIEMPDWLGIVITFLFINVTWVFFRAPSWNDAINVLEAMIGMQHGGGGEFKLINDFYSAPIWIASILLLFGKNSNELVAEFEVNRRILWRTVALVVINIVFLNSSVNQEFLYFDF